MGLLEYVTKLLREGKNPTVTIDTEGPTGPINLHVPTDALPGITRPGPWPPPPARGATAAHFAKGDMVTMASPPPRTIPYWNPLNDSDEDGLMPSNRKAWPFDVTMEVVPQPLPGPNLPRFNLSPDDPE